MTAIKSLLKTIGKIKEEGKLLSEVDLLIMLKAAKSITKNKSSLTTYLALSKSLDFDKVKTLSRRELQVFESVGNGLNSALIAKNLKISISTVETHRKNIRKKLDLTGKGKLIEYALLYNLKPKK